jgi:hypothetical protein
MHGCIHSTSLVCLARVEAAKDIILDDWLEKVEGIIVAFPCFWTCSWDVNIAVKVIDTVDAVDEDES